MFTANQKGFSITFANGHTVSVQFGEGNYCSNRHIPNVPDEQGLVKSKTAEVIALDGSDFMGSSEGWQTPDQVLAFMNKIASLQPA